MNDLTCLSVFCVVLMCFNGFYCGIFLDANNFSDSLTCIWYEEELCSQNAQNRIEKEIDKAAKKFGDAFVEVNQDEDGHIYGLPSMTHCYIMVYDGAQLEKDNKAIPTTPEELSEPPTIYVERKSFVV